eukprot:263729-Rhodomonas_salina.1
MVSKGARRRTLRVGRRLRGQKEGVRGRRQVVGGDEAQDVAEGEAPERKRRLHDLTEQSWKRRVRDSS